MITLHDQAFADDISFCSATPELNQLSIDALVRFLVWAHMQANPKKCISFASKKFDPRFIPKIDYERYGSTVYCPYDPQLTINGEKLKFIVNTAADPNSLQFDHFKELGRWISLDLSEVLTARRARPKGPRTFHAWRRRRVATHRGDNITRTRIVFVSVTRSVPGPWDSPLR